MELHRVLYLGLQLFNDLVKWVLFVWEVFFCRKLSVKLSKFSPSQFYDFLSWKIANKEIYFLNENQNWTIAYWCSDHHLEKPVYLETNSSNSPLFTYTIYFLLIKPSLTMKIKDPPSSTFIFYFVGGAGCGHLHQN